MSGRLRSLPAEERQRLSSLRWYQSEVPVFRVASADSGLLQVYLHVEDLSAKTLDGLRENGVWIEQAASDPAVVQGFVSIDDLECIAELPYVRAVTRPTYSICSTMQSVQRQGLYGDETIDAMDVGMLRTAGLDGTGVTVGVLSVGLFDSLYPASGVGLDGRLLSGDLPSVDPNGLGWTLGGILAIPSDSPFYHEVVDAGTLLIPPRGDGFNGLPTGSFFQQTFFGSDLTGTDLSQAKLNGALWLALT